MGGKPTPLSSCLCDPIPHLGEASHSPLDRETGSVLPKADLHQEKGKKETPVIETTVVYFLTYELGNVSLLYS